LQPKVRSGCTVIALSIDNVATLVSALAFIVYGLLCLFTSHMKLEFERYGLSRFRRLVGTLELAGGAGLLLGFAVPWVQLLAAAGLSLLMALGLATRLRVRDKLVSLLPALLLLLLNLWIITQKI
jgi:hypothetical protein